MALKALMLRKKIDIATKALADLRSKDAEFEAREKELRASMEELEETSTDEERQTVEEAVESFEAEQKEHEEAAAKLENEIRDLEEALAEEERSQETTPEVEPQKEARKEVKVEAMQKRGFFKNMSAEVRSAMFAQEDVQAFLGEVRDSLSNKRALTNVGALIPEVFLGILKENMMDYSKLYKHVTVRNISGHGREVIQGEVTEAIWTECCANLNELDLPFYTVDVDCWKVAGYYSVCNAVLEDSDIDLANTLLDALAQAIGIGVDKAIVYGLGTRMPLGFVTRLAQTEEPSGYPQTARPWVDLSSSNIITIPASATGKDLFAEIILASGAMKSRYARGGKVWAMNETTYTKVVAAGMSIDASGSIVSGVNGQMPVVGGVIEVLNFIPDDNIVAGFFDLYLLAERAGAKFLTSEHVRFLNDQTVFKGVARYDGQPMIAESFVVIGINGTTPTTEVPFSPDAANVADAPADPEGN